MTKTLPLLFPRKNILLIVAVLFFSISSQAITPVLSTVEPAPSKAASAFSKMSVEEFVQLTPKKYKEITGEKLSLSKKISLKIAQSKMKKAIRENKQIDMSAQPAPFDTYDFNLGGLILGFVLPILGVLIAYLIDDPAVIKWAWIGFGIFFVLFLLIVIL